MIIFFQYFFVEFYKLDTEVLIRSLRTLEYAKKAELIMFDDNQGVKFFWLHIYYSESTHAKRFNVIQLFF